MKQRLKLIVIPSAIIAAAFAVSGCSDGYSNSWPYPEEVKTVYVEMFDSQSFRRDHEYVLTDAVCKRIEAQTPYKIVSDRDIADSLLTGRIENVYSATLTMERESGTPLQTEAKVKVVFDWKDLQNGKMLLSDEKVFATANYSSFMGQTFEYAADIAVNRAAQLIVERMQKEF